MRRHLLSLVAIAGVLRFVNLGQEWLWFDEAFTAWVTLPSTNFWEAVRGDTHPPLWSIIQWFSVRLFGYSEFAARIPAALLSVFLVLLIYLIARKLFEPQTAYIAGFLGAILPTLIYYGQDARQYTLLSVTVLLMVYGVLRENWILASLGGIGAVYTQNVGVAYTLAVGLAAILPRLRFWRTAVKPALAFAGVVAAWLPWVPTVLAQAQGVQVAYWTPPLSPIKAFIPIALNAFGWRMDELLQLPVYAGAFGITVVGLINGREWLKSRNGMLILAGVFGGPAILALLSLVWRSVYVYRALLPSSALLCLVWAYPLAHLGQNNRRIARAVMVPLLAIGLISHYFPVSAREDIPAYVAPVREQWQKGDVIYYLSNSGQVIFGWYLPGLPYAIRPNVGSYITVSDRCVDAFGWPRASIDDLIAQGYTRAWVPWVKSPVNRIDELEAFDDLTRRFSWRIIASYSPNEHIHDYLLLVDLQ